MGYCFALAMSVWPAGTLDWISKNPSSIVALIGLAWGIPIYVLTRNATLYSTFDTLYQAVLQIAITNGKFRNPDKTSKYKEAFRDDDLAAYDSYAYMVFNVCETIADGLNFYTPGKKGLLEYTEACCRWFFPPSANRVYLRRTWLPVLKAEMAMHKSWLNGQRGGICFKREVLDLMNRLDEVEQKCGM